MSNEIRPQRNFVAAEWEGWERNADGSPLIAQIQLHPWDGNTGGILTAGIILTVAANNNRGESVDEIVLRLNHSEAHLLGRKLIAAVKKHEF